VENKSCCHLNTTNISCTPCAGTTDTATSTDSTPVIVNMENIQIGPIDNGEESSVGDLFSLSSDDTMVIAEETVQEDRNHTYSSLNELGAKIVSFPQLKERIESNFVCKKCLIEKGLLGLSASSLVVKQKTYGIATVFDITCKNGHDVQIIPELIDETQEKYSTNNFMLNYKLLLLMQLLGKGLKSIAIVTALLGICVTIGNYAIWKKMLNQLGEIQTKLAKNCCKENLQKEIDATIAKGDYETCGNRVGIVCSGDAGWQGGGSRNIHNSISGHTLLVGGYTKLVLAFKFFSKLCQTCNTFEKKNGTDLNDTAYPKHRCARNWSESSKAMEPRGIVECATLIWDTGKAWMRVFVSDDDSSSRAALKHNIKTQMFLDKTTVCP